MVASASTRSSKAVPLTMELFQHRYYNTNKNLMSIIGLWPYKTCCFNRSILAVIWFLKITLVVPQILAVVRYHDDWKTLMDCVGPLLIVAAGVTKYICFIWNSCKMLQLLNCIRTHWEVWAGDEEVNILHKYAERGRQITFAYTVILCSFGVLYATPPVLPKIIDTLLKNGSETGELPFPVDYHNLDMQKYYFYIIMHLGLCQFVELVIAIATDTMFIVYVQHGCGLFSALGHKLQRAGKIESGETVSAFDKKNMSYNHIASCIVRHNDAIEYAEVMEATYSWYLFFNAGYTIIGISITGIQIINNSQYHEGMARYIGALLINTLHIYMDSYFCQKLIDHSISIRYYIHNSNWYKLPSKDQKLLHFVIMRSNLPSKLTAGKMFVMSVETFVAILKSALSYFTLFRSI